MLQRPGVGLRREQALGPTRGDCNPAIARSSVDLPDPFAPMMPIASPTPTWNDMSFTACTRVDVRERNPLVNCILVVVRESS